MTTDYLPRRDAELMVFANAFAQKIAADPAAYGLTAGDAAQLGAAAMDYAARYAIARNPATRTAAAVAAKDGARKTLTAILRGYAMMIKRNGAVSSDAKVALGIGVYDVGLTPVPAPTTFPIIHITGATPLQHELRLGDSATPERTARPEGTVGLLLFCQVAAAEEPVPTDGAKAPFLAIVTRAIHRTSFDAADVGKTAYYFARWFTERGLLGPWSQAVSMTVAG